MKKLLILTVLCFSLNSMASAILDCHAKGTEDGKVLFETQLTVFKTNPRSNIASQGTEVSDHIGDVWTSRFTELRAYSNDHFQDNISIFLLVKIQGEVVEAIELKDMSLKNSPQTFGAKREFGTYSMKLECKKI